MLKIFKESGIDVFALKKFEKETIGSALQGCRLFSFCWLVFYQF